MALFGMVIVMMDAASESRKKRGILRDGKIDAEMGDGSDINKILERERRQAPESESSGSPESESSVSSESSESPESESSE